MTSDSARTKAFAKVLGPLFVIMPAIIITRMAEMDTILSAFFGNPALVFIAGAGLVALGLVIITQHQSWSGISAILISLMGWLVFLRGLALLIMPDVFLAMAHMMLPHTLLVRLMFGVIFLIGLRLSYSGWRLEPTA